MTVKTNSYITSSPVILHINQNILFYIFPLKSKPRNKSIHRYYLPTDYIT
jgi:hypothetical protein